MPREPFEGSDWGEREADRGPPEQVAKRRVGLRQVAAVGAAALALAAAGFVVANATGFPEQGEVGEVDLAAGAIADPVQQLHAAQRKMIRAALNAPFVLGIPRARLEAIAECESGGDPRAKSSDGLYRGKYQFHRGTWASVGGVGDPARASELEQDRRAAMLIKSSGSNPWPICGS